MVDKYAQTRIQLQDMANTFKNWVMVALTLIFILLYGAALFGWLKPLADVTMVTRLEPILFIIIGYYFGRLPANQNEKTLKDEINRQEQRADAAQHAKEQVQQSREALEEKVKNAKAALTSAQGMPAKVFDEYIDKTGLAAKDNALRQSVITTLNVLNS